uniref:AGC-kinase C-terminal domain-containing protein n=1 Tax=Cyprinus carpio TaxID=7962 RepID=A0A8C1VID5_CYPCA
MVKHIIYVQVTSHNLTLITFFFFFLFFQKNRRDTGNFDKEFTKMVVELTPTDKLFIMNLDQNEFQGFSYTNPEFVIQV